MAILFVSSDDDDFKFLAGAQHTDHAKHEREALGAPVASVADAAPGWASMGLDAWLRDEATYHAPPPLLNPLAALLKVLGPGTVFINGVQMGVILPESQFFIDPKVD